MQRPLVFNLNVQKIPIFALLFVALIAVFFVRAMFRDERQQIDALLQETQCSRQELQTCLEQRNRIVRLATRIGNFDQTMPAEAILTQLSLQGLRDVKYSKLADMLAGAQNRLALSHLCYEKRAGRLRTEMEKPLGVLTSRLFHISSPTPWTENV